MPYNYQVAIPTLTGSLLSCVATSCVLISYIVYADQQRSFRHALVLNLALAEFINSLNNSVSGIYAIANKGEITAGPACTLNGWIGQWSVQAADFSILAIAIITLLTITRKTYMPNASLAKKILICASVWFVPTITSTTAAGMDELTPVSGNWCWISGKRTDLRYALGHGWRFTIIFVTIGIYIYIWIYMRRHFTEMNLATGGGSSYSQALSSSHKRRDFRRNDAFDLRSESQTELHEISVDYRLHSDGKTANSLGKYEVASAAVEIELDKTDRCDISPSLISTEDPFSKGASAALHPTPEMIRQQLSPQEDAMATTESTGGQKAQQSRRQRRQSRHVEREIKKMLLLNAYPVFYIILWLPGIINRLVEAAGHSSKPLAILQSSTQYIGFANAITYGFNEHLRERVKGDLTNWVKARR